eukprot:TRINITY_DN1250_c1_g1_i1.p1 TRINITY_DN1250_c1_g1~~TRINITY_DN1250_c1_g1_i1.p1  ORF type:complete len:472 (+),score=154.94 TRINITY_DN1250_c1_g1_i1:24-1418(+)
MEWRPIMLEDDSNSTTGAVDPGGEIIEPSDEVTFSPLLLAVPAICTLITCIISFRLIVQHLRNYTQPTQQRCVIRIVFIVPIYAIFSLLSLFFYHHERWFALVRDCYEAYALYMFYALCVQYAGGEDQLGQALEQLEPRRLLMPLCCYAKPGKKMLKIIKQLVLQYVIVKPVMSVLATIFLLLGLYAEGEWRPDRFYLYSTIVYNVGVSVSLYAIVLFETVVHEELHAYKPMLKFAVIKLIVAACYWQGICISAASAFGLVPELQDMDQAEVGVAIQNLLICIEMVVFAILHAFAYPVDVYRVKSKSQAPLKWKIELGTGIGQGIKHTMDQSDLVADTVDSFVPRFEEDPEKALERQRKAEQKRAKDTAPLFGDMSPEPLSEPETIGAARRQEDATGMVVSESVVKELFKIGADEFKRDVHQVEEYYKTFQSEPVVSLDSSVTDHELREEELPDDDERTSIGRR